MPEDMAPDELTVEKAEELLAAPSGDRDLGADPSTGLPVVAKAGRYGPYVTEVLPDDAPKTREAAHRVAAQDDVARHRDPRRRAAAAQPAAGRRRRPGRRRGDHRAERPLRAVPQEGHRLAVAGDRGAAVRHHPRRRRWRSTPSPSSAAAGPAAPPLKELGADPATGLPVVVKEGRFGAYVTDGETNATLRKADSVETVTIERAAELLAEKRAKGPAEEARRPKKTAAKKTAKKTTAKKTAARSRPAAGRRRPPAATDSGTDGDCRPRPATGWRSTTSAACAAGLTQPRELVSALGP